MKKMNKINKANTLSLESDGEPGTAVPVRGRPGRRTIEERSQAVLELLSGKASVQQLSMRFCVQEETIMKWREDALQGMSASLRRGTGKSARERALEKELNSLRSAFTDLAIRNELIERSLRVDRPPSRRGRSAK